LEPKMRLIRSPACGLEGFGFGGVTQKYVRYAERRIVRQRQVAEMLAMIDEGERNGKWTE